MIPYGRQQISEDDIDAVVEVLRSDFLTQGPQVGAFEAEFAARAGALHGVAANSATSALHVAYLALGLSPGDTLWTAPITFVATANAARMCGANVGFVDVEADTGCMDVSDLERRLALAEAAGALPKIVVPIHLAGRSCDMAAIADLARTYGFRVVEDASHAVGASHGGQTVGACAHSDIAVFSFHPVKIVTTGEGGLATTNDDALAGRMRLLTSHGVTRDPDLLRGENPGGWYYEQLMLGFNYRMTDIQAALGRSQLQRLDDFITRRRSLVRRYEPMLGGLPLATPGLTAIDDSSWHLYVIRVAGETPMRSAVFEHLRGAGIGVQVHYIPVHLQPYYQDLGFAEGDYPAAEDYYARAISLPLHPSLSEEDQDRVVEAVSAALRANA